MKHYNLAFVGIGSIGKRHFKNICSILEQRGDSYTIDLYRSDLSRELPIDITSKVHAQYLYSQNLPKSIFYDAVFVTNPTSLHLSAVLKFIDATKSFFIEKPVFNTYVIDDEIIKKLDSKISYVACPMRFSPVLQFVKNNVNCIEAISVRAISSSYLPDWRPGQDYRTCYSAHANMGGGVDIDLIHEWDYLVSLFGMPSTCNAILQKISNLEIDSNDIALYIGRNEKTAFELHLDYFGRKPIRTLDIFLPAETIHCDILNGSVEFLLSGRKETFDNDRNVFHIAQMEHFFDIIDGKSINDSCVSHAVKILKLTKGKI